MTQETEISEWTLAYEMEGSDDAAWVLRHPAFTESVLVDDTVGPDDDATAKEWACKELGAPEDLEWVAHYPGPGSSPDYWTARFSEEQ